MPQLYDTKLKPVLEIELPQMERGVPRHEDGRLISRKTVGPEKLSAALAAGDIGSNAITKIKMADDAIGLNEWDYETADITITGTSTSGTATVESGAVPIAYFLTAFTTPTASYVQLVVSGTTLTATLSTAPGAGNSITIRAVLLQL